MRHNLSEITAVIKDRRTIYPEFFSDRKIHREILEDFLNNAIWAPTHGKTQPWRFKVFTENGLNRLSKFQSKLYKELMSKEKFNDMKFDQLKRRPLLSSAVIAICMERDTAERISELDEIGAMACAVQNIHLTATAYGIGGFWATPQIIHTPAMQDFLNIGEKDKCLGLFYLGYPKEKWPKSQRKPIEYVTEWIEN